MKFCSMRGVLAGLFGLALLLPATASQAAPKNGDKFKDWTVQCDEKATGDVSGGCWIAQNVVDKEANRPVMNISVAFVSEFPEPAVVVTLPLGINLPPGVIFQIDENPPFKLPVSWCLRDGCRVRLLLKEEQLAVFKAGTNGKITFQQPSGQGVTLPFSLQGFTAALTALKS